MRKFIIFLASFVTLLLVAAAVIPLIFKDDIRNGIKQLVDNSIDAKVLFDASSFRLTLFKNFPNPTATLDNFGIIGTQKFAGDTLLFVENFDLTFDLFSIFGETYAIKSLNLSRPRVKVMVLADGSANYEIIRDEEVETTGEEETADTGFVLRIDQWNFSDGQFIYQDKTMDLEMYLKGISHTGGGNLSMQEFDLKTITEVDAATISYEGVSYLNGQHVFADAVLGIDIENFRFTFKDNTLRVNDFPVSFDGFIAMPEEDIQLDISFAATDTDVKSFYSLIPAVYTTDFESVTAEGAMKFNGYVRGVYNESSFPAYNVALQVSDGMISYAGLPTPISNINMDMLVACNDGILENTSIDIAKFHLELGDNPIDGKMELGNLKDYSINARANARIDLSDLSTIFPIEDTNLKGQFLIDLSVDGVYDSVNHQLPAISASMSLKNGYIKNTAFANAIEDAGFNATVECSSGKMEDMAIDVSQFRLNMGKDQLTGKLQLHNMMDYQWYLILKGGLDLAILSEVYPIEGMNYKGHLMADIETRGKYSDVEAGRYSQFPTSGTMTLSNFFFESDELPQGIGITESTITMNSQQMSLVSFDAAIGKSDLQLNGDLTNHLQYLFGEGAMLKGKLNLTSRLLDINQWITGEESAIQETEETARLEVVKIPENIDFEFNSSITNIYYDNLRLQNAKGLIAIREGVLDLDHLTFDLLGGAVNMSGKYDSRTTEYPSFDYSLNVKSLSIPKVFTSFSTVQAFAPMAEKMTGSFSTGFQINGMLNQDMTPVFESMNGSGLIQIAEASVAKSKLVKGIAGFMKGDSVSERLAMNDVKIKFNLENGRAHVAPFEVSAGGQKAQISGSIGADGTLDYFVDVEVDAGAVGQQINRLMSTLRGDENQSASSKILLNFNVAGTYEEPRITLAGSKNRDGNRITLKEEVQTEVRGQVESTAAEVKSEIEEKAKDETAKLKEKGEEKLQEQLDTLKKEMTKNLSNEAKDALGDQLDSTTIELQKTIKNLFKKKKN